ncbi:MAG: glutamate-cysteine ligase family protein [Myxococcota bacterium]|nr:glutamate-cysteine ligase family protein [Myxococcota bacterium]
MTQHLSRKAIIERFHSYGCAPKDFRIGAEFERIMLRSDGRPVGYHEPHGVRWVLEQLMERFGWDPYYEGEFPIALLRDGASTTLEPGGQLELSGAPFRTMREVQDEANRDFGELQSVLEEADIHIVALGLTPFVPMDEIPWVPKGRYRIMREYLPKYGDMAHVMMKGTSSFQANFDYVDEADCGRKMRVLSALGPLTTATFANSPLMAGKPTGYLSTRGLSWTRTDPARTGFPPALLGDWSHEKWVDYLLSVPMMFIKIRGEWVDAQGRSFQDWIDHGIDGVHPTWADWELHETSVFPEVRVKKAIEVRGADAVPLPLAIAGITLWTGFLYDSVALDEVEALVDDLGAATPERFLAACRDGLEATIGGRLASEWAQDLVRISARGLSRSRPCERALLDPIEALVAHGQSPAQAVLRIWEQTDSGADRSAFLRRVLY